MGNTLTPIIRAITVAFAEILNEKAALPALVDTDFSTIPAALGQAITVPFTPLLTANDRTPAVVPTAGGDQSINSVNVIITRDKTVPFNLNGDDYLALTQPTLTPGFIPNSLAEAMRVMRNLMHSDLATIAATGGTGAVGAAGTTPFASDLAVLSAGEQLLNDSLAPGVGRVAIFDTSAKKNLNNIGFLVKANESGSTDMLRRGMVGDLLGFGTTWDNDIKSPAVGTGANYVLNANQAVGDSSLALITGTGTILAGDIISIAGDPNFYHVLTGIAAPGTIVLNTGLRGNVGGLRKAASSGAAVTVASKSVRNIVMHRQAIKLVARPSAMPPDGDMAADSTIIMDPITKLPARLVYYKGYGRNQWELQQAWGYKVVRPELLKNIMG